MSVSVRNLLIAVGSVLLGLWMGLGPWLFGVGGDLTRWYLILITVPFIALQFWVLGRIAGVERRGRSVRRSAYGAIGLSWLCALGFGVTVPGRVDGQLVSALSHLGGAEWLGMSIALCNPLGIIAFSLTVAALVFALLDGRDPRPTEDELLDQVEADKVQMVSHPLSE